MCKEQRCFVLQPTWIDCAKSWRSSVSNSSCRALLSVSSKLCTCPSGPAWAEGSFRSTQSQPLGALLTWRHIGLKHTPCCACGWLQLWWMCHHQRPWHQLDQQQGCVRGRLQVHHMLGQRCSVLQVKEHGCLVLPPRWMLCCPVHACPSEQGQRRQLAGLLRWHG